jgi:hypothetical protein
MTYLRGLLAELDERTVAERVAIAHDEVRASYRPRTFVPASFDEFSSIIADYYNYHFTRCVSGGGGLSPREAAGRAKELLERDARRHNGDIVSVYNNAHDGTNGGLRRVLDTIADGLKSEAVERYVRDTFDRYVTPNSWEDKVEIIRQFIADAGPLLSRTIQNGQPERYAHNYQELVRSYVSTLQQTSSIFRRL